MCSVKRDPAGLFGFSPSILHARDLFVSAAGFMIRLTCFWRPKSGHPVPDLFPRLPCEVCGVLHGRRKGTGTSSPLLAGLQRRPLHVSYGSRGKRSGTRGQGWPLFCAPFPFRAGSGRRGGCFFLTLSGCGVSSRGPWVASSAFFFAFLAAEIRPMTRPIRPNPQLRCRLLEPWDKTRVRMG